jgi:hypothetical protein
MPPAPTLFVTTVHFTAISILPAGVIGPNASEVPETAAAVKGTVEEKIPSREIILTSQAPL